MRKLLVALLVLGLASPAMAATWHFYGSVRQYIGYTHVSNDYNAGLLSVPTSQMENTIAPYTDNNGNSKGDGGLWTAQSEGQARVGAQVVASDYLTGVYEVGFDPGNFKTRLLYGTWNFGPGKLTVGQDYTPATFLGYSSMIGDTGAGGDAIMLVTAIPYISRQPQIKLSFKGFQLALIQHNMSVNTWDSAFLGAYSVNADFYLPRIEASYQFNSPMVSLKPILGIQTYKVHQNALGTAAPGDQTVTSWLAGLGVRLRFGAAYVNLSGGYSVNPLEYGLLCGPLQLVTQSANLNAAGNDVEDADMIQSQIAAGFRFNPKAKVEAGVGYMHGKGKPGGVEVKQTAYVYYLNAIFGLAPGVSVTPEIGYIDNGKLKTAGAADVSEGNATYGVVKFQIDF